MLRHGANQSVVVNGESGAGKTEACKKLLFYLAQVLRSIDRSIGGFFPPPARQTGETRPNGVGDGGGVVEEKSV